MRASLYITNSRHHLKNSEEEGRVPRTFSITRFHVYVLTAMPSLSEEIFKTARYNETLLPLQTSAFLLHPFLLSTESQRRL